jgi:GNAT superfamily N-acetyltransferase
VCAQLPLRSRSQHARRLEAQIDGTYRYLIAWVGGRAIGHVGVGFPDDRRIDEVIEWRGRALVDDLYVDPAHRRRGIGRALMTRLEHEALAAGLREVGLDTGLDDGYAPARALYADLGYERIGDPYIVSARMPPDARPSIFLEILAIWTKRL